MYARITVFMWLTILLCSAVSAQFAYSQQVETLPISMTDDYLTAGRGSSVEPNPPRVDMTNTNVFDRGRRGIEFGLNWGSSGGSDVGTTLFGLTVIDDYPEHMEQGLLNTGQRQLRIIAALNGDYAATPSFKNYGDLIAFYSNGIASQIDPELLFNATADAPVFVSHRHSRCLPLFQAHRRECRAGCHAHTSRRSYQATCDCPL